MDWKQSLLEALSGSPDPIETLSEIRKFLFENSPLSTQPVDLIRWVPIDMVEPNDYNPNSVAKVEMKLLYTSIKADGYTQPVVTIVDKRGEFTLPCGHISSVNICEPLWKIRNPLIGSSAIPLELSTEKEALASFTAKLTKTERADIVSKLGNLTETTASAFVSGFKKSGELEKYMSNMVSAMSGFGMSQELTTLGSCSVHVCPTCWSKRKEDKSCWTLSEVKTHPEAEFGIFMSFALSESAEALKARQALQGVLAEVRMQLGLNEMNWALRHHLVFQDKSKAIIVDGFHRYFTCKNNPDILARNHGRLPIVVIDKPINDRMASTVRHNRARGKHSVNGMSSMVFEMLENGWDEVEICAELGMEPEEVLRLKHITGFSKLFEDAEYKAAWVARRQIEHRATYRANHGDGFSELPRAPDTPPS